MKMPHWPNPIGYRDIDLGLSRVYELLEKLGNPHKKIPPVIHVAGTNGKGSTIAFINSILNEAGYKSHIYTSPNLVKFNERIILSGKEISDEYLYEILERCRIANNDSRITFFEGITVAAFLAFSEISADFVLLETGLGGRLDSTNVIDNPIQTILTPISMDHQEFLGDDIAQIAYEKCGIIKESATCITSYQEDEVVNVITKITKEKNTELIISPSLEYEDILLGLKGEFQKINAATAVCAIKNLSIKNLKGINISEENIQNGLKNVVWKGRFQKLKSGKFFKMLPKNYQLFIDGGHNVAAANIIKNEMQKDSEIKWHIILGMLREKDVVGFINIISGTLSTCYNVTIPNEEKSCSANELYEITKNSVKQSYTCTSVENAINSIVNNYRYKNCNNHILICGSLYLISAVLESEQLNK